MPEQWRVGRRNPHTVYRQHGDEPRGYEHADHDDSLGYFRYPEDARLAVDAVNAQADETASEVLHRLGSARGPGWRRTAHCCEEMTRRLAETCDQHPHRWHCPDLLVTGPPESDVYGLWVHDGGSSYIVIRHCPWCGAELPSDKHERSTEHDEDSDESTGSVDGEWVNDPSRSDHPVYECNLDRWCAMCGDPATHKVGEEAPTRVPDNTNDAMIAAGHNLTNWLCCLHFRSVIGDCGDRRTGDDRVNAPRDDPDRTRLPAGSAVGQRGAPTRDGLVRSAMKRLEDAGPTQSLVPRAVTENAVDVALEALRDGGADREDADERDPRCTAFHPEYGFTCPYLPEGHGRWHWDPAGGYWDAAGQYIDGAEDVVEQPGGGPDTGGEDDDDEVRMPPPERETIYATSADPHGSVDLNRSTGVLVATCRCGESATMWGGGSADAQRWWDKHRSGHDLLFREGDDEDDEQPHSWTELADEFKGTAQGAEEQSRKHEQETGRADLYALGRASGRSEAEARIRFMAGRLGSSADTRATIARLSTALGVSLDPDDPDPVGRLVEAAGKATEVEVVSAREASELPGLSRVVRCDETGVPFVGYTVREVERENLSLGDGAYLVLYRAPDPAPAALAVGEVVDTAAKFATLPESARLVPCDEEGQPMVDMQVVTPQSYLGEWDAASDDAPFVILTLPAVRVGTGGGES